MATIDRLANASADCIHISNGKLLNRRLFDFYVSEWFILQFLVQQDNIETAPLAKLAECKLKIRRSLVLARRYGQSPNLGEIWQIYAPFSQ